LSCDGVRGSVTVLVGGSPVGSIERRLGRLVGSERVSARHIDRLGVSLSN
jgi:hypothetical protein